MGEVEEECGGESKKTEGSKKTETRHLVKGIGFPINHLKLNPMKNQSLTLSCFVFFFLLDQRP